MIGKQPGFCCYHAIFLAAAIAALTPFAARIFFTRARSRGFNPRIVPMYAPWSLSARRWVGVSRG